jgi:methionine-rich copper-binding protein CopC
LDALKILMPPKSKARLKDARVRSAWYTLLMAVKGMKMKQMILAAIVGIWATGAFAHSPLKTTTPADGTTISAVPTEISLGFKGKIRLTRVSVSKPDQASVDLDLSGSKGFISDYSIPFQLKGAGIYQVEWRGLGDDGHALNGSFSFTVD